MTELLESQPRELVGRETIARFDMQFQAAAFASLEILKDKEVDRVYCDWHDDFVVRKISSEGFTYCFYQVKTKGKLNHLWSLLEVFALKKRGQKEDAPALDEIQKSFAGKLLLHSISFQEQCQQVTLLTNVQFHDDVIRTVEEFNSGKFESKEAKFLKDNFAGIFKLSPAFDEPTVLKTLKKISLVPGASHIGPTRKEFSLAARKAIHHYSEIDLTQAEIAEIAQGLIELIHRKSFAEVLSGCSPGKLDDTVGVGLKDLLGILSISRDVYQALKDGGDPLALKSASVIQRLMKAAGATDSTIEFMTQQKVLWDIWLRTARHSIPPYDVNLLLEKIEIAQYDWSRTGGSFGELDSVVNGLLATLDEAKFGMTRELLLGGILAAVVRRTAR